MEPALAIGIVLVFLWRDLSFARERERYEDALKAERTEIALLHVTHREHTAKLFDAYREDVAQLCQRIQAPELAVVEHQQGRVREPDSHPLTDEQIAEQQEAAELIARMERVENEGVLS